MGLEGLQRATAAAMGQRVQAYSPDCGVTAVAVL
jgi:hypothetical protein